ncbi:MAG: HDIG domain-containing protein [Firmicutes bacterium]|nr:HDIG domain-containing protein [Bacillota bacterium]
MLRKKASVTVPEPVLVVCRTLQEHGFQAYIVGGAVRDALLGKEATDWDVTTDALPDQIERIFAKTIPTGRQFGTISVVTGEQIVEVTTMRKDAHYSDGRRPDYVEFTSDLKADLSRRDFTINAIAYDPLREVFHDPFAGMRDLRRRILRTVGESRERFSEDALRMLRLIRFSAVLGFKPEKRTLLGIQPHLIVNVANERIKEELNKLLAADAIVQSLQLFYTCGLMEQIIPELAQTAGINQGSNHAWDVLGHSIITCQAVRPKLHLRWAALLHDVAKPQTFSKDEKGIHFYNHDQLGAEIAQQILKRLTYSNKLQNKVGLLIRYHMYQIHPDSSDKALRRLINRVGVENIYDLIELRKADILGMKHNPQQVLSYYQMMLKRIEEILAADSALSVKDLAVTGTDLIYELNLKPGPMIGKILNFLLDQVLDQPELNTKADLITLASSYLIDNQLTTDAEL